MAPMTRLCPPHCPIELFRYLRNRRSPLDRKPFKPTVGEADLGFLLVKFPVLTLKPLKSSAEVRAYATTPRFRKVAGKIDHRSACFYWQVFLGIRSQAGLDPVRTPLSGVRRPPAPGASRLYSGARVRGVAPERRPSRYPRATRARAAKKPRALQRRRQYRRPARPSERPAMPRPRSDWPVRSQLWRSGVFWPGLTRCCAFAKDFFCRVFSLESLARKPSPGRARSNRNAVIGYSSRHPPRRNHPSL